MVTDQEVCLKDNFGQGDKICFSALNLIFAFSNTLFDPRNFGLKLYRYIVLLNLFVNLKTYHDNDRHTHKSYGYQ